MTNDFSNIPAETPLRDEITVRSDEFDPVANPAYEGPMGVFTDYEGCDTDPTVENDDFEDANDRERDSMEPDESMVAVSTLAILKFLLSCAVMNCQAAPLSLTGLLNSGHR